MYFVFVCFSLVSCPWLARIQSHWRRYVVRREYLLVRSLVAPREAGPKRAEWFLAKLVRTSSAMAQLVDGRQHALDALFAEMDRNVSRVHQSLQAAEVQLRTFSDDDWKQLRNTARTRADKECPICMQELETGFEEQEQEHDDDGGSSAAAAAAPRASAAAASVPLAKRSVLLSCSHVLHHGCLLSFERFTVASNNVDMDSTEKAAWIAQQKMLEAAFMHDDDNEENGTASGAATGTGSVSAQEAARAQLFQPPPSCLCPLCRSNYQKAWL